MLIVEFYFFVYEKLIFECYIDFGLFFCWVGV